MARTTKSEAAIKETIDHLSCDAIHAGSMNIDWQETRGEDGEGWRSKEANACEKCGAVLVLDCGDGGEHSNFYNDGTECPQCRSDDFDGHDGTAHCNACGFDWSTEEPCDGYVSTAEGPMMNYWYPVEIRDCDEAARKLADLPLCVVEFRDEQTGLALTGGGMDLSWEICEAFIKIGYLPPYRFCDLPKMAGLKLDERHQLIIAACRKTCEVLVGWATRSSERIDDVVKSIKRDNRKRRT